MSIGFDGSLEALQKQSRELAKSESAREEWYRNAVEKENIIQQAVQIWKEAIERRLASRDVDENGKIVEASIYDLQDEQMQRAIQSARILRNAAIGSPESQELCFEAIPAIIHILWTTTSFAYEQDKEIYLFTRTLVQLMSNTVTTNNKLQGFLWKQMLCNDSEGTDTTSRPGADLLERLLHSFDAATSTATQVLLLNCTLDSEERSQSLSKSTSSAKLLSSLLEVVQRHLDSEEGEMTAEIKDNAEVDVPQNQLRKRYESIGVLYTFFTNLFDQHLFGSMLDCLAPEDVDGQASIMSIIGQSQLSLLRLFDSYLHSGASSYYSTQIEGEDPTEGLNELMTSFERLATWADKAMKDALEGGSKGHVDPRLIEVHIGLILLLQCLITLGLKAEGNEDNEEIVIVARSMLSKMRRVSFVQLLVSLLHTLAKFAPPISPFRPSFATTRQTLATPPPGHALTSTGAALSSNPDESGPALDNLKRDIVNLLGVLSYKRASDDKEAVLLVQDTVRQGGGLFDVLNMTQLDEHNPYIRERAIFTLRNLLLDNQDSQDLVSKLKPVSQ